MFGFFIGWGVFWLLIWAAVTLAGFAYRNQDICNTGQFMSAVSMIYLIAVIVGKLAAGI